MVDSNPCGSRVRTEFSPNHVLARLKKFEALEDHVALLLLRNNSATVSRFCRHWHRRNTFAAHDILGRASLPIPRCTGAHHEPGDQGTIAWHKVARRHGRWWPQRGEVKERMQWPRL